MTTAAPPSETSEQSKHLQRVCDGAGVQHVVNADRVALLGLGVLSGPGPAGDGPCSELGFGGAIAIHVGPGDECVISRHGGSVGLFIVGMTRARLHDHRLIAGHEAAQAICHGDHDGVGHTGGNGGGGHIERHESGAASGVDRNAVPGLPTQVLGHCLGVIHDGLCKGIAGDQAVDVLQCQPGVAERHRA